MAEGSQEPGALLVVENLHYAYATNYALRGVSFTVAERSIHGFVGPNGAGKTTTLKILATLLSSHHGKVRVFGMDLGTDCRAVRRRLGFMPDHFGLYRQMSVFECLDFFAAAYGLDLGERTSVIEAVLTLTDMQGRRDELIRNLSRGMQQRVSLARVLVHDPDLLLLDEPASGLDPRARIEMMEIFKELRRMGKTIFVSSHILSELADLCDSVTIIDRGEARYSGSMEGLQALAGETADYVLALQEPCPGVQAALEGLEGVKGVERLHEDGAEYRVAFDRTVVDTNAILCAVMAEGGCVTSFAPDKRHLSEAFMELTSPGVP